MDDWIARCFQRVALSPGRQALPTRRDVVFRQSTTEDTQSFYYQCISPGTSAATEPTWMPGTTTDGTVVWRAFDNRIGLKRSASRSVTAIPSKTCLGRFRSFTLSSVRKSDMLRVPAGILLEPGLTGVHATREFSHRLTCTSSDMLHPTTRGSGDYRRSGSSQPDDFLGVFFFEFAQEEQLAAQNYANNNSSPKL